MSVLEQYNRTFAITEGDHYFLYNPSTDAVGRVERRGSLAESIRLDFDRLRREFVVLDRNEDYDQVTDFFRTKERFELSGLSLVETMSFKCNLSCVYCFQQSTPSAKPISASERVTLWEALLAATGAKKLGITLFGGEPFLNMNYLEELFATAEARRVPLKGVAAVTNGTLLTDRAIGLINRLPFQYIQVTLDGPPEVHDARRLMKKGSSFDKIIECMCRIFDKTSILVYLNTVIDSQNVRSYRDLVRRIVAEFPEQCLSANPRIIFNLGNECQPAEPNEFVSEHSFIGKESARAYYDEIQWLFNEGLAVSSPFPSEMCIKDQFREIVTGPDGAIYDCISGVGLEERKVCDMSTVLENPGEFVTQNILSSSSRKDASCMGCDYYAMCNGGCAYGAMLSPDSASCQKPAFDLTIDQIVSLRSQIDPIFGNVFRKVN